MHTHEHTLTPAFSAGGLTDLILIITCRSVLLDRFLPPRLALVNRTAAHTTSQLA